MHILFNDTIHRIFKGISGRALFSILKPLPHVEFSTTSIFFLAPTSLSDLKFRLPLSLSLSYFPSITKLLPRSQKRAVVDLRRSEWKACVCSIYLLSGIHTYITIPRSLMLPFSPRRTLALQRRARRRHCCCRRPLFPHNEPISLVIYMKKEEKRKVKKSFLPALVTKIK